MADISRYRRMMTGKIHRVHVTQADVDYVGSITIDADLMESADILVGQEVDVVDVSNGARLTPYAIPGERGSGIICINGAAARLIHQGDIAIIMSYSLLSEDEAHSYTPRVVFVDDNNKQIELSDDPGHAPEGNTAGADGGELRSSSVPFDEYR